MSINTIPLWYRQISFQKEKRIISNGLTIPYLIGSYQICNQNLPENPIKYLMSEIKNSQLDKCAVIQMCPNIGQYVVGIDDRKFCEMYMKKQIQFKNTNGQTSLVITLNAEDLGDNFEGIIDQFVKLYDRSIANSNFSWNNDTMAWENFTSSEIDLIKKGQFN